MIGLGAQGGLDGLGGEVGQVRVNGRNLAELGEKANHGTCRTAREDGDEFGDDVVV